MRRIIFPSVTGLPLPYFFTLFHIRNGYRKEMNTEFSSRFYVQILLETFLIEEINDKWT